MAKSIASGGAGTRRTALPRLHVMISSRCEDKFPAGSRVSLSEVRKRLKADLEAVELLGHQLLEVWINEDAPPAPSPDIWQLCLEEVDKADVVLVLYNGNAGWTARPGGGIGICHAEFDRALSKAPGKVRMLALGDATAIGRHVRPIDVRFQDAVRRADQFQGSAVMTEDDLVGAAKEAVAHAVVSLAKLGVRETRLGQYHLGEALAWSKLDYQNRARRICEVLLAALQEDGAKRVDPDLARLTIAGTNVLVRVHAIPAATATPAAREMVGRPFLHDHQLLSSFSGAHGPLHLIGCSRSATETQAVNLLGFPDAVVVRTPFGIYAADEVQKIQFVMLQNCRDEAMTRLSLQRFLGWLEQSGEGIALSGRAKARKRIIQAIAAELKS